MKRSRTINFPASVIFRYNFRTAFVLILFLVITVFCVALAGLLHKDTFYPTEALKVAFLPNDIANLVLGLPLLVFSIILAQRGKTIGFLCLPGALFYMLYSYIPYLLSVPLSILFLPYILIITLSATVIIYLVAGMNGELIRQKLEGKVPVRLSGGILFGMAILIMVRQLTFIIVALIRQSPINIIEKSVWIDDLVVACPVLITVGISLWRKTLLGYSAGAALLLSYGILVLSLLIVIVYNAYSIQAPIKSSDIAFLLIMAGLCLWPFTFFAKAALENKKE